MKPARRGQGVRAARKRAAPEPRRRRARPAQDQAGRWSIEVDAATCSLCDVCARACPTGALVVQARAGAEELVFDPDLCDACRGEVLCCRECPEDAIRMRARRPGTARSVLVRSLMVRCRDCGDSFVAAAKLASLARRAPAAKPELRERCFACRRRRLAGDVAR